MELLGGIGNEHTAGLGDTSKGVIGGESFAAKKGGKQKRGSPNARAAVGYDASSLEEIVM